MIRISHDGPGFCAAHFVVGLRDACARLHGHSYSVEIEVEGYRGKGGVVVDFGILQELLGEVVEPLRHRLLVPMLSESGLEVARSNGGVILRHGGRELRLADEDCAYLQCRTTSTEDLAVYLLEGFLTLANARDAGLLSGVVMVLVELRDGAGGAASASRKLEG